LKTSDRVAGERMHAANLVKLTVFLTDMDNLGRYREARNRFFASSHHRRGPR